MKILIGVLAFFVFLILAVAGSCAYIAYRVKQKTHEFSESMHTNAKPYTGKRQPCAMLTVGRPMPWARRSSRWSSAAPRFANIPRL
jgi:uncharacterized membrane protein